MMMVENRGASAAEAAAAASQKQSRFVVNSKRRSSSTGQLTDKILCFYNFTKLHFLAKNKSNFDFEKTFGLFGFFLASRFSLMISYFSFLSVKKIRRSHQRRLRFLQNDISK